MSAPKLSFSLGSKAKATVGASPPLKRTAAVAFGNDEQDAVDAAPTARASGSKTSVNKQLMAQSVAMSKKVKQRQDEAKRVDATVFMYDEVYDKMQHAKKAAETKREEESQERKPRYIKSLLESAETRRLDHLRAEEKMYQRERETEGDMYAGTESFVTQAYKDQIAEMREAEEEEKKREEANRAKAGAAGMSHYYKKLLERESAAHDAAVAAGNTVGPTMPQGPNLTIQRPPEMEPLSDLQLAKEAALRGQDVEVNDSGEIVDKRELLLPGLNLSAPNTRRLGGLTVDKAKPKQSSEQPLVHRAVGAAASQREIRERQARQLDEQLETEERRKVQEQERKEREENERRAERRNDDQAVMSARERYLARKKARSENPQKIDDASS
ncbi:hypothetical protein DACRYDRAFT_45666 [Dacryopinax primogenitus]|uniref:Nuclear speckle splicing regulatory protein 1 N-terminal domain-containing protein n=1 Tax=Dacryopinax primogenitus (strain DJM 731) TaxID=1858805 RepID=M5G5G1_DACPD|nr:uncharacterized protein DACRYDRAFT_45666 [Dacryopinax primogenitus]EJU05491.1 hypothetical protein DACRYDRAFT_45666 [Dacryopinax primogenitus]